MSSDHHLSVRYRTHVTELEDTVRRRALELFLAGDEEASLDLLAAARAMAEGA